MIWSMTKQTKTPRKKKKKSSVRHTRSNQRDRSKRPVVAPPDEETAQRLGELMVPALIVSQQAISERLRFFPSEIFLRIFLHIVPVLREREQARQRPLPPILAWAKEHYTAVLAADGSTLDALMRKVGLLRDSETYPLAGKIMAVLDLCSWLPHTIWYEADDKVSDQSFSRRTSGRCGTELLAWFLKELCSS